MTVQRTAAFSIVASGFIVLGLMAGTASAQSTGGDIRAKARPAAVVEQKKSRRVRARTRIRVTPVYPYRLQSTPYPTPYTYEYPGPNAVRQCTAWLASEYRPSGTVIVPHMRCWWERR